jgi:hypothetical protein
MASALRSVAVFAVASALAVLSAPGCSQQGEGERCDISADCDSGLTCVSANDLLEEITNLCCPSEGDETTQRCTRKGTGSSTGGTSNGGSGSGLGGTAAGGTAAGAESEDGGTSGSTGIAGEPSVAGAPTGDAGAPGGGVPGTAGAPAGGAGQGGAD